MKKNDVITLEITGMTAEGSGVGRYEGMAVFVPMTTIGDVVRAHIVKVKKTYAYGKIIELVVSGNGRCVPDCNSFSRCGGCVYRHISYETECGIKQERVQDAITRIGGIALQSRPIISAVSADRYRNKAQYPIAMDGSVGFFAVHSHRIIPCDDCALQPQEFAVAAQAVKGWINKNHISIYDEASHSGLLRHLYLRKGFASGEIMVVLVINGNSLPFAAELITELEKCFGDNLKSVQININRDKTNVILGDACKVLYGQPYITDVLCGVRVRLSPLSFYQVNRDMAEMLYKKAAEYAEADGKDILDLYCGAGTIGLSMASKAKSVIGVEIIPQAIEDAKVNAAENGITNARFICADASQAAKQLAEENIKPQVVIVDPPRKGCTSELLQVIANSFCPERVVYVSCDPATLARDAAIMRELGYELKEYTPVDLFPRTAHVETVALLSRQKVDEHIYFDVNVQDLPKTARTTATYPEIKAYVKDKYGLNVTSLNIAQVKEKHGFEKRENYNKGKDGHRVPNCPPEKEKAIEDAFKHFEML